MTAQPLIFPIGHYVGAYYPKSGAALRHRKVRIAVNIQKLHDEAGFELWKLCHGFPELVGDRPWTRHTVLDAANYVGLRDAAARLDELVGRGLVAEVTPGTAGAERFASRHRIQPLMTGIGNNLRDPLRFSIGIAGNPVVTVESLQWELWQWGRDHRSLHAVAELFAKVARQLHPDRRTSVGSELDRILAGLHVLLASHAAYLDQTLPPPTGGSIDSSDSADTTDATDSGAAAEAEYASEIRAGNYTAAARVLLGMTLHGLIDGAAGQVSSARDGETHVQLFTSRAAAGHAKTDTTRVVTDPFPSWLRSAARQDAGFVVNPSTPTEFWVPPGLVQRLLALHQQGGGSAGQL